MVEVVEVVEVLVVVAVVAVVGGVVVVDVGTGIVGTGIVGVGGVGVGGAADVVVVVGEGKPAPAGRGAGPPPICVASVLAVDVGSAAVGGTEAAVARGAGALLVVEAAVELVGERIGRRVGDGRAVRPGSLECVDAGRGKACLSFASSRCSVPFLTRRGAGCSLRPPSPLPPPSGTCPPRTRPSVTMAPCATTAPNSNAVTAETAHARR